MQYRVNAVQRGGLQIAFIYQGIVESLMSEKSDMINTSPALMAAIRAYIGSNRLSFQNDNPFSLLNDI